MNDLSLLRHDWTEEEISALLNRPFLDLLHEAQTTHRRHFRTGEVQTATLLSIKTGACPEDCAYCPQSAHYRTGLEREDLLSVDEVLTKAKTAQAAGSTRFCLGAAWREVRDG